MMLDKLKEAIDVGTTIGASYIEIRHLDVERTTINLLDGKGKAVHGYDKGFAIRVLNDGAWGFVSIATNDINELKNSVKDACSLAKISAAHMREKISLHPIEPVNDDVRTKFDIDPRTIPTANKHEKLVQIHDLIVGYDEKVKSTTLNYTDITGIQTLITNEGTSISMEKCVTWLKLQANGKDGTLRSGGREEIGSIYGYEFMNNGLEKTIERLSKRVITNLKAEPAIGGQHPVVIGPPVAGVLAHEACGHLFEADLTLNGCIGTVLGQKIGSELATIVDDGIHPDGFGTFKYDDEGVPSQNTCILKKGVVNALLTNREYASKFSGKDEIIATPSGSARAFDFRVAPIIRMRNTYFEPGDMTFDELLEPIKFGYYCVDFRGGQASLEGTFTVGVQEAFEIVNGDITKPVRGASISGNTLETLEGISGVGKKDSFSLTFGRCGKGQTAFTGDGGPNLRVDKMTVGGEK